MADTQFPKFQGKVTKRDDADYEAQCYQYASSSYLKEGIIQPAAIINAANDDDVIKAIKYAKNNNIAVAVRTGGHQYSGGSSTNGKNIQLDLSETYKEFQWENDDCTLVTTGVSFPLGDFNKNLGGKRRFVPHGQCQYVHVGGHVQTGGYGQLARGFGLLADHVKKFRIITVDGQPRWVRCDVDEDADLFYAVLGGSPGNFGVITHVTFQVHRDEDYPNSRGFRGLYPWGRHRLQALLDVMVEMAENEDFPNDFDYCVTVLSEPVSSTLTVELETTYDEKFRTRGEQPVIWCPVIIVFVQWSNLEGAQQQYDPTFVHRIKQAAGLGHVQVSDDKHIPISQLTRHWVFPIEREFALPYVKRTYASNASSQRLKDLKWSDWISRRIDGVDHGISVSAQLQHFGGRKSRFYRNGQNSPASYSWRDTNLGYTIDAFYNHAHLHDTAKKWQEGNDKGVGKPDAPFCEHDHRLLWASHDLDLSANREYYYDNVPEGKYERLCEIKKRYDPTGVFTPNRFCIGLPVPDPAGGAPAVSKSESEPSTASKLKHAGLEFVEKVAASVELSVEDKFWKLTSAKHEKGKPIPLWETWTVEDEEE